MLTIEFRDWIFLVDKELTKSTYDKILASGADTCICDDCKNYVTYRDHVFPSEIKNLFSDLGIDYRKEVEITTWQKLPNGLHQIGGWFHFKGKVLKGKDYRVPFPESGYTIDLTKVAENFSIGFAEGKDLTFFEDKKDLVQIEFETSIPWVIDKKLETE